MKIKNKKDKLEIRKPPGRYRENWEREGCRCLKVEGKEEIYKLTEDEEQACKQVYAIGFSALVSFRVAFLKLFLKSLTSLILKGYSRSNGH